MYSIRNFVRLSLLTVFSWVAIAPTISQAAMPAVFDDITFVQQDGGVDLMKELWGDKFACDAEYFGESMSINKYFVAAVEEVNQLVLDWRNGNAAWDSSGDSVSTRCTFVGNTKETNVEEKFDVVSAKYGPGVWAGTCDKGIETNAGFDYVMSLPQKEPNKMMMVLPDTSAESWGVSFSGYNNCAWTMSFQNGAHTITGTVEQDMSLVDPSKPNVSFNCLKGWDKIICVGYQLTSKVYVVGGTGDFANATGDGTMTEARTLPAVLINMPFEISGSNAISVQSVDRLPKPILQLDQGKKVAKGKSTMKFKLTKNAQPSVRLASPPTISGVTKLGLGRDGKSIKIKLAATPKSSCGITAVSGATTVVLLKPSPDKDGVIKTSITSDIVARQLNIAAGSTAQLTTTCTVGAKKVILTSSVVIG